MNNSILNNNKILKEDYFEWEVSNINSTENVIYSPEFVAGGQKW